MKKFILSICLSLLLFVSPASAEFFTDVIVTSPNGIWTDSRAYIDLPTAIDAVGSNIRTVKVVSPQTVTALTVPSNVTLEFERDGAINNSGQLTLNTKNIIAENRQIFTGAGDIDFASGTLVKSGWFADFETAVNQTSDDTISLSVTKPNTVTSNCALGDNVILQWDSPGNIITTNTGITVSNIGQVIAGKYQIFAGAGNFRFRDGTILNLDWFNNLRAAITYASTNNLTLIIQGSHTVGYSDTILDSLTTRIVKGGVLSISPGVTLTYANMRSIDIGSYGHDPFTGAGSVAIAGGLTYTPATTLTSDVLLSLMNLVSDTAYGAGWSGDTIYAPSKDSLYNKIETLMNLDGSNIASYYFPDYSEADQGITGGGASVKAYVDTIGANSATLWFRNNSGAATTTYTFSTDETIPSNVNVIIEKGAILSIANTKTLTINGPFSAGLYQVFSGSGSVSFGYGAVTEVYPEWWQTNTIPGTTDMTSAINSALATGRKTVLSSTTYAFAPPLIMSRNNQMLAGQGWTSKLKSLATGFTAIGIVESTSGQILRDFELQGRAVSEEAIHNRGITVGVNTAATAHSALSYDGNVKIQNIHITGVTPGTNGFNIGIKLNEANKTTVEGCLIESIYGTNSGYGHGIVVNGEHQKISRNIILSTIANQGRHGIYSTDAPMRQTISHNYVKGFQSSGITNNTGAGYGYTNILYNIIRSCCLAHYGTSAAGIEICSASEGNKIIGNTIEDSGMNGIFSASSHTIISSNTIENSYLQGIWVGGDHVQVINNFVSEPSQEGTTSYGGIEIDPITNYGRVIGNIIKGTSFRFGVRINATPPYASYTQIYDNIVKGTYSYDIENENIGAGNTIRRPKNEPRSITASGATLDISRNVTYISLTQSGATNLTNIATGVADNQVLTIHFGDANTTVVNVAGGVGQIALAGHTNVTPSANSTLTLCYDAASTVWYEIGRSIY